jgi:RNA polymerase sigma factor (sigma-70 family)
MGFSCGLSPLTSKNIFGLTRLNYVQPGFLRPFFPPGAFAFSNFFHFFALTLAKRPLPTVIGSERGNYTALRLRKEVNPLELSSFQQKTVQYQFESFGKKVLKHEARNYYTERQQRGQRERLFSELSTQEMEMLFAMDEYMSGFYTFKVLGYNVAIQNARIGKALNALTKQKRDIILLSYFLDMTDVEIGEWLNIVRSTVQYQRTSTLLQLKKHMDGEKTDE